jgi:hypothetical protein
LKLQEIKVSQKKMPGVRKKTQITQIVPPSYWPDSRVVSGSGATCKSCIRAQVQFLVFPWPACKAKALPKKSTGGCVQESIGSIEPNLFTGFFWFS